VEQLGAERILFGSDMPGSYLVNVGQVEEANLTHEQKDLIYYKNALRMLHRSR
jgi:predicted TIM-barrel fold metal-dependent hydrolase